MKPHKHFDHAYAIVRVDEFLGDDAPLDHKITVKLILWDADEARDEVARLNGLQREGGVRYFSQPTRIQRVDVASTGLATASQEESDGA
jgi:hypothetical protein